MRNSNHRRRSYTLVLTFLTALNLTPQALADRAEGDREDLANPFTDASLDSRVSPLLAEFGPGATLGDADIDFGQDIDMLDPGYNYGLTDRVSIVFHAPYYYR